MEWPHFSRLLAFAGAGLAPAGCIPNSSPMTMGQPTFVRPVLQAGSHVSELMCVKKTQTSFSISTGSGFSKAGKKWFRGKVLNKSFQARCRSKGFPGEVQNLQSFRQARLWGKMRRQGSQARYVSGIQQCTGFGAGLEQPETRFSQDSPKTRFPPGSWMQAPQRQHKVSKTMFPTII